MTGDENEAFPRHTQDLAKEKSCCWRSKGTDGGAAEPKLPKRWRRKGWGGPSEGWISKTAPDEPGDGISVPESGPRIHTCWRMKLRPREKIGVWVTLCQQGFLRRVDRPSAPWNLRSPAGEELAGKVGRKKSLATRGSDGDDVVQRVSEGEWSAWKETRSPEKKKN